MSTPPPIECATSARLAALIEERAEARRATRGATCDNRECGARAVWTVVVTVDQADHARRLCGAHYDATTAVLRPFGVAFMSRAE